MWSESRSVMSNSLWPHGLYSPWNSPGQNTGAGSLSLLRGIFPTQRLNLGLPHCRWIFYQLSHQGVPRILQWVAYPFSSRSSWPRNRTRVSCFAGGFFTNWAIWKAQINYTSIKFKKSQKIRICIENICFSPLVNLLPVGIWLCKLWFQPQAVILKQYLSKISTFNLSLQGFLLFWVNWHWLHCWDPLCAWKTHTVLKVLIGFPQPTKDLRLPL